MIKGIVHTKYVSGLVVSKLSNYSGHVFYRLFLKEDRTGKNRKYCCIKETDIVNAI